MEIHRQDSSEGSKFVTLDRVRLMIHESISVPLARIEDKLDAMEATGKANDSAARDSRKTKTDYLTTFGVALITWLLAIASKKLGLF